MYQTNQTKFHHLKKIITVTLINFLVTYFITFVVLAAQTPNFITLIINSFVCGLMQIILTPTIILCSFDSQMSYQEIKLKIKSSIVNFLKPIILLLVSIFTNYISLLCYSNIFSSKQQIDYDDDDFDYYNDNRHYNDFDDSMQFNKIEITFIIFGIFIGLFNWMIYIFFDRICFNVNSSTESFFSLNIMLRIIKQWIFVFVCYFIIFSISVLCGQMTLFAERGFGYYYEENQIINLNLGSRFFGYLFVIILSALNNRICFNLLDIQLVSSQPWALG